jgi:ABC-2 type transport system ATP-binding protein
VAEQPAVAVTNLSKVYEPTPGWMRVLVRTPSRVSVTALDAATFSVDLGQLCAVIGPNGAGKSTLFRILTGLTTPSAGHVSVLGRDPVSEAHIIRRQVGFMPAEDRSLFLRHTCRENLRFHGRLQGIEEAKLKVRIDEVLTLVGLWDARDRAGFALSSGMRARLMLARAIIHEPQVLILDEPTGSIDPIGAHDFLDLIIKITVEQGTATLISSHRLEEIDALRDNILLMDRGRIVFGGNLDHVKAVVEHMRYEVLCVDADAAGRVAQALRSRLDPSTIVEQDGSHVRFPRIEGSPIDLTLLTELGTHVESVSLRKLSMRETIAALLQEGSGS